ncbi:MAG: hypothetical protein R2788_06890 [Saprospiraceae bacterium]
MATKGTAFTDVEVTSIQLRSGVYGLTESLDLWHVVIDPTTSGKLHDHPTDQNSDSTNTNICTGGAQSSSRRVFPLYGLLQRLLWQVASRLLRRK